MDTNILPKSKIQFSQYSFYHRFILFLGVGLGSGLAPKAPGTFGSLFILVLIPLWLWCGFYLSFALITVMSIVGFYICGHSAKLMNVHDDGRIVWDEFAGQSIALLPLIYFNIVTVQWVIIAFLLFRLFDIWKPWPISIADEKLVGGLGIMLDDLMAGIWAALCIIIYFLV